MKISGGAGVRLNIPRVAALTLAAVGAVLMSSHGEALADNPEVNVNTFRPSLHPGDILGVRTNTMPKQWDWGVGAWFTYQYKPFSLTFDQFGLPPRSEVLRHQFTMDLYGHVAFLDWLDVGVALPFVLVSKGDSPPANWPSGWTPAFDQVGGAMLGDMRLAIKARVIGGNGNGFGFGISEDLTFPTATKDNFAGDTNVTSTTRLIGDYSKNGWSVALNLGFRFREPIEVLQKNKISHQLLYGLGVSAPAICDVLEIFGSMEGHTSLTDPTNKWQNILDFMAGLRWYPGHDIVLTAAAGRGVLEGYGSPEFRGTLMLSYLPHKLEKGCGGPVDSDGDGIPDAEDACPGEPGPVSTGGCPDRDGDGIVDSDDLCPDVPGLAEFDGCPDTDGDGIGDGRDACPKDPGVAKYSGCPDTDGDGIPDIDDKCPEEPGVAEHQGCPAPPKVEVKPRKPDITEVIHFAYDKAVIKHRSHDILREVAQVLKDNPQIRKVVIEGHTDSEGTEAYNKSLSLKRAKAVKRFLVKRGVKASRLDYKGYGFSKPIGDNSTEEGRAKNRRVEFTIIGP